MFVHQGRPSTDRASRPERILAKKARPKPTKIAIDVFRCQPGRGGEDAEGGVAAGLMFAVAGCADAEPGVEQVADVLTDRAATAAVHETL
jgi:hypothetical protein